MGKIDRVSLTAFLAHGHWGPYNPCNHNLCIESCSKPTIVTMQPSHSSIFKDRQKSCCLSFRHISSIWATPDKKLCKCQIFAQIYFLQLIKIFIVNFPLYLQYRKIWNIQRLDQHFGLCWQTFTGSVSKITIYCFTVVSTFPAMGSKIWVLRQRPRLLWSHC